MRKMLQSRALMLCKAENKVWSRDGRNTSC
jgi:hypothetical protein